MITQGVTSVANGTIKRGIKNATIQGTSISLNADRGTYQAFNISSLGAEQIISVMTVDNTWEVVEKPILISTSSIQVAFHNTATTSKTFTPSIYVSYI